MHVVSHDPFRRRATGPLGSIGHAFFAKVLRCGFKVSVFFHKRLLAIHHSDACLCPELFDHLSGNSHQIFSISAIRFRFSRANNPDKPVG
jgi:hypothetical protein